VLSAALHLEGGAAGCSKILVLPHSVITHCHFTGDCNLYMFVNEGLKYYQAILQ
jgi:hypothetical protein